MLRDVPGRGRGDNEDMNRERAETYLRALAETELRRATMQPRDDAQRADHAGRVNRVAQVLAFVGALDAGVADQILGDFELALAARQTGQAGSVAGRFPRRAALAKGVSVPPAAAGGSAAGRPCAGAAAGQAPAQQIARVLLQEPLPRRWAHVQGVADRAPVLGADADLPEAAAWLHDIGYAPGLATTCLHQLDGARYLRDAQHADAMLCRWSHTTPVPSPKPANADSPTC